MIVHQKNQYCQNDYITQSNLLIQCNLCQITQAIFTELKQYILQLYGNKKTPNSQRNLEEEK